jgi:hypothetical protein
MAAVTRVKARPVTPVGYEVNDTGLLTEAVTAGDLLTLSGSGWSKAATSSTEAHGIALQDGYAGQANASIGVHGEMDGYSGMTPGTALYPSASVAGGLDTDTPTLVAAVNEVQTVTLADAAGADTWTLTFSGQTTSALDDDASAATVQGALEALSNIAVGDVTVTGSAGGPYTVTFAGVYAGKPVALMTGTGTGCTVTVAETTPGVNAIAAPTRVRAVTATRIRFNFV